MPINASLDLVFKAIMDNIISRMVGFIVRFFTIITGLTATILCFCVAVAILLFWLCLPVIVLLVLIGGWI